MREENELRGSWSSGTAVLASGSGGGGVTELEDVDDVD